MIAGLISIIVILLIALIVVLVLKFKPETKSFVDVDRILDDIFAKNNFIKNKFIQIDKRMFLATNKNESKLAIVKNLNLKNPTEYELVIVPYYSINEIADYKIYLEIQYFIEGIKYSLKINSAKKSVKDFIHNIFKKTCISKIKTKYPSFKFDIYSACNWQCDYVWAYSKIGDSFVYYDTEKKTVSHKMDLMETNLTIDTKYAYFEMSIYGISQQLIVYENEFLDYIFESLLSKIKIRCATVVENALYFDTNGNIVYLTDDKNSLQIVKLDDVEEVYYSENKISFKLESSEKTVNYLASKELVKQFEQFVVGQNVRKIAVNFNYASDKLINTSENTKLLIDFSRERIVYCANLNTFSKFGYYVFAFNSIKNVEYKVNGMNAFVRLTIDSGEKIDISCKKRNVAEYIMAQIKVILNER